MQWQSPESPSFLQERPLQQQLVHELLLVALQQLPPVQRLQPGEDSTELTRESRCSPLEVEELGAFGESLGFEARILERVCQLFLLFHRLLVLQPMEEHWWYCEHDLTSGWPRLTCCAGKIIGGGLSRPQKQDIKEATKWSFPLVSSPRILNQDLAPSVSGKEERWSVSVLPPCCCLVCPPLSLDKITCRVQRHFLKRQYQGV